MNPGSTSSSMSVPCVRASISTSLRSVPSRPSRSSSGGRSPRISERSSSSASPRDVAQALELGAGGDRITLHLGGGRLGGEHHAEQLLADHVVQLEGEAVSLREDRQFAAALVQAGVGDRDRRVRGQQLDQFLILLVEGIGVGLLGQVEGADDRPVGRGDRDAQERAHVRVLPRPPSAEARVVVDVVGAV